LIRVAIYADTLLRAQQLAALLGEDERLDIVQARAVNRPPPLGPIIDVVLAAGLRADTLSRDGPPLVLLSREPPRRGAFSGSLRAWLPEDALPAEISAAIVAAAQDFAVLTPGQVRRWLPGAHEDELAEDELAAPLEALTPRELQVLRMMADGLGNKQIAAQLAISDHTAKFHVAQILAKLNASSRTEAVTIAIRRGLVPI
jgi:two-component system, NarL family, response regulator YdfI